MGGEEVVDESGAIVVVDGAQSGEVCEDDRAEEFDEGEGGVEFAEHGTGVGAGEDVVEGLAVLLYDAGA